MDKQNGTRQTENKQSEFDRSTAKERIDRIDPYGFERSEDFDYDSHEEFMSVYLAILTRRSIKWSKLLKRNNKVVKNIKVKRYVRKGIPNEHRSLIWMAASGAQAQLEQNPGYYRKLLEGERDPRLEDTIKTDMHRTFPDNVHFRKNADPCLQQTLFNVLLAYGHHNRNVGYCQTVLRIWDCLFYEGSKIIFRVALTLIKHNQAYIQQATNFPDICDKFKEIIRGELVDDCHTFMQKIFTVPGSLSMATITKLRETCQANVIAQGL